MKKRIVFCLIVAVLLVGAGVLLVKASDVAWVAAEVKKAIQESPIPIQVRAVEAHWSGLSVQITLRDVKAIDREKKVAFFTANTAQVDVGIWTWLVSRGIAIKRVTIAQAALMLKIDEKQKTMTIVGLRGEPLSTTEDSEKNLATLLAALKVLDQLSVDNLHITWKMPWGNGEQTISGTFAWKNKTQESWKANGNYTVNFGQKLPTIVQNFSIEANKAWQQGKWALMGVAKTPTFSGNWAWAEPQQGGTTWDLSVTNVPVNFAHPILEQAAKTPFFAPFPEWVNWLNNSIREGFITHAYWRNGPQQQGEIYFDNTTLLYDPDWLPLKALSGKWQFANDQWQLSLTSAKMAVNAKETIPITALSASGGMKVKRYEVRVNGSLNTTGTIAGSFLQQSGLKKIIGDLLVQHQAAGALTLTLQLIIPIEQTVLPLKIQGDLAITGLGLKEETLGVALSDGQGKIQFTEEGLRAVFDQAKIVVPESWPMKWPSEGKLSVDLQWDRSFHFWMSSRFANAWDAKIKWFNGVPINGQVIIDPKSTESSEWPLTHDRTITVTAPNLEARIQRIAWAEQKPADPVEVKLAFIKVSFPENAEKKETLSLTHAFRFKRPVQISSDATWLNNTELGKVEIKAVPDNQGQGWKIEQFTLTRPNLSLSAKGRWVVQENQMQLAGQVASPNFGNFLSEVRPGKTALKEGNMQMDFDIQWLGSPLDFAWTALRGTGNMTIRQGRLMGVNVGFGRILSLLSVENLVKRVFLDFRDVYKKGFVFDKANIRLVFEEAELKVKSADIRAPVANVEIYGSTNIKTEALSLFIKAIPQSATSTIGAPLVGSLVNPVLGVGLWAVDTAIRTAKQNRPGLYYRVTGTWDNPEVKNVPSLE